MANEVQRARAILGNIANDAGTALDALKMEKFGNSVVTVFGPQQGLTPEQIAALTNAQKAGLLIAVLRGFLVDVHKAAKSQVAAEAARLAALAAVDADDAPDLGG